MSFTYDSILTDILTRKGELELLLNDYKKLQSDYNNSLNNIKITFSSNNIQQIDGSTKSPIFYPSLNTFTISRGNSGSFPRFRFRPDNNVLDGTKYKKVKVTFRWAGTVSSYDKHNLANKSWCIGIGSGASTCRTTEQPMPPKTGEYVTYTVNANHSAWNNANLEWLNWKGPSTDEKIVNDYPLIWEFKDITIFSVADTTELNKKYNEVKIKVQEVQSFISQFNNFDIKNKDELTNQLKLLIKESDKLSNEYNNTLNNYNNYHTTLGQNKDKIMFSKSNNISYMGWIILIISIIWLLLRSIVKKEETTLEKIIFIIMILVIIYYIFALYGGWIINNLYKYTPSFLYKWMPPSVINFINALIDFINNKLLVFDYVK